jgi:hypothetical protein
MAMKPKVFRIKELQKAKFLATKLSRKPFG